LIQHLVQRLGPIESVTTQIHQKFETTNLLSFDEGEVAPGQDINCCGTQKIGSIFSKILDAAERSRSVLQVQREELAQPCAANLTVIQTKLANLETHIRDYESRQVNVTGDLEMLELIADIYQQSKDILTKEAQSRLKESDEHTTQYHARQEMRDGQMKIADEFCEISGVILSDAIIHKRESSVQTQILQSEKDSSRDFVQSHLQTKMEMCAESLADYGAIIAALRRKINALQKMVEIISYGLGSRDLVNALSTSVHALHAPDEVQSLIDLARSSTKDIVAELLTLLQNFIKTSSAQLQDAENAQLIEQTKCDEQIKRLRAQLEAFSQQ
jgi:cob(I)alamin adenosyltransferase